jgi:hypothetical protein
MSLAAERDRLPTLTVVAELKAIRYGKPAPHMRPMP